MAHPGSSGSPKDRCFVQVYDVGFTASVLQLCDQVTFGAGLGKRERKEERNGKASAYFSPLHGSPFPTPLSKKDRFSWGFCYLCPV